MKKYHYLLALLFFISCDFLKKVPKEPDVVEITFDERDLDTLFVQAPPKYSTSTFSLGRYNPTAKRQHDLIHTKLDVSFDWEKQHLLGEATLELKPYFYETQELLLDAKGFDIHRVGLLDKDQNDTTDLKYQYNQEQILISLDKVYTRNEHFYVYINYTAKPNERESGGSMAITSDKGLYFINPFGTEKNKPQQIWTQGETEASSCWFPTIDKPNERCTQEIYITVKENYKTLSNGLLKSSVKNDDGTRTDYWDMDKPHAPYLFMMAIGEFAVVTEEWKGLEMSYWVEPEYEADAKAIFSNTLEMMDFFSEKLGVPYHWQKYAQIVVRDYVSGAMENTTGVIFGEFMQKTTRELIDNHNEGIVAHELIHHWFGNLVTCESWANLTLNEAFANYGEYLWLEHKYGKQEADLHLFNELQGYLYTNETGLHDLIDFDHVDKEDMFDAHSYNKGGCIMHMLRNYVGDEAFFASLKLYLERHQYKSVEAHDLRLAFEEITGEDLNWFFNQWFFAQGHPELEVLYSYDTFTNQAVIEVEQLQNTKYHEPIYQLPLKVDVYLTDTVITKDIFINQRYQRFHVNVSEQPKLINLDADHVLVGSIVENKQYLDYVYQYYNAPTFYDRYSALSALSTYQQEEVVQKTFQDALNDPFWLIVYQAINAQKLNDQNAPKLRELIFHPHSQVRVGSVNKLKKGEDAATIPILIEALEKGEELSYPVIAARLKALYELSPKDAINVAQGMQDETYSRIVTTLSEIFSETDDIKYLDFFYKNAVDIDGFYASKFYSLYTNLLLKADDQTIQKHAQLLSTIAQEDSYNWKRYHAAKIIKTTSDTFHKNGKNSKLVQQLDQWIAIIKASEPNDRIQNLYRGW